MNLYPLIRRLSIVDKNGQMVRLEPNWAQRDILDTVQEKMQAGKPIRIITLKARQIGCSTIAQAIAFTFSFVFPRLRTLVVANEIDNAQHLLSMSDTFWETYPFKSLYTPQYASRNEKAWVETKSSIRVATAKNTKAGRSKTIHVLHASECGFWEDPKTTMLGLRQAIPELPGTMIMLESTANGVGNYFYETWQAAETGDVDFVPLFFPWHLHPEYQASAIGLPYHNLGHVDSEERILRNIGVSDDRLAWRRWAIKNLTDNDLKGFHQEFPSTPMEAFIATGTNVFPIGKLREVYEPIAGRKGRLTRDGSGIRFQPDIDGPLTIYRWPSEDKDWGIYMVGGDATETTKGDFACGQVISRRTLEQVAVFRMRLDPGSFAEELAKLGAFYNDAVLVPEYEGPGAATVSRLILMNYPYIWQNRLADTTPGKTNDHYGWRTTAHSKELAIGWMLKFLVDGANERVRGIKNFTIHDQRTFAESRDYVTLKNGGYGPASSDGFDDTVMALAIVLCAHALESPVMGYSGPEGVREPVSVPWEDWSEQEQGV